MVNEWYALLYYKTIDLVWKLFQELLCMDSFKGIRCVFKKEMILWMKTIHYPNKMTSHLVTITPMAQFTLESTSKLRSALHFRYSIVIPHFIPRSNTAQS